MMQTTGTLWHYLASFVLYTGLAIGIIYAVYFYARKHGGALLNGAKKSASPAVSLQIESSLPLEPRKTLYVVRAGRERFLIATAAETTQVISRLELPPDAAAEAEETDSAPGNAGSTTSGPGSGGISGNAAGRNAQQSGASARIERAGGAVSGTIELPPWYAQPAETHATDPRLSARPGIRARLVQSVQWLIASRSSR